jgi:hypothetical protein
MMPIVNGKDLPFGQASAGLPDVSAAIMQLFQPVVVGIIKATQINGRTQTVIQKYINTQGVRIATDNKVVFSKTGERFWAHEDVYFLSDILLKADDLFLFNKTQYRVLAIEAWTEYGYNKYTVLQDYTKIYVAEPVVIRD